MKIIEGFVYLGLVLVSLESVLVSANSYNDDIFQNKSIPFYQAGKYYYHTDVNNDVTLYQMNSPNHATRVVFNAQEKAVGKYNVLYALRLAISPNGKFLTYSPAFRGPGSFDGPLPMKTYILDLETMIDLDESVDYGYGPFLWKSDSSGFYYINTIVDMPGFAVGINYHALGTNQRLDTLVAVLKLNGSGDVRVYISEDEKRLHVVSNVEGGVDYRYGDFDQAKPGQPLKMIQVHRDYDKTFDFVSDKDRKVLLVSNVLNVNGSLVQINLNNRDISPDSWVEVIPGGSKILKAAQVFSMDGKEYILVHYRGQNDDDELSLFQQGKGIVKKFSLPTGRIELYDVPRDAPVFFIRIGESALQFDKSHGLDGEFKPYP